MTPSESFDPRTWRSSTPRPPAPREPAPAAVTPRASRAGFVLSAVLLIAGAVGAYVMREPAASEPVSAPAAPVPG